MAMGRALSQRIRNQVRKRPHVQLVVVQRTLSKDRQGQILLYDSEAPRLARRRLGGERRIGFGQAAGDVDRDGIEDVAIHFTASSTSASILETAIVSGRDLSLIRSISGMAWPIRNFIKNEPPMFVTASPGGAEVVRADGSGVRALPVQGGGRLARPRPVGDIISDSGADVGYFDLDDGSLGGAARIVIVSNSEKRSIELDFALPQSTKRASFGQLSDIDQDGNMDIVVAHRGPEVGFVRAILMGSKPTTLWEVSSESLALAPFGGCTFGQEWFAWSDLDGDQVPEIVLSEQNHQSGLVLVLAGQSGHELHRIRGPHEVQRFGVQVSGSSDWDKDGNEELAISSGSAMDPSAAGRVHIIGSRGFEELAQLRAPE